MSYIRADAVLPQELLETIQRYVEGKLLYIPRRKKQEWGSETNAKAFFRNRDIEIYQANLAGASGKELARRFSLSEKSIQRILRKQRLAAVSGEENVRSNG